jgi:hypothetical protein
LVPAISRDHTANATLSCNQSTPLLTCV